MGDDAILWSFIYFYHMDKANAAIHCAPVRFSPIVFQLLNVLMRNWPENEDYIQEMAEVRHHDGQYEVDKGR